MKDVDQFDNTGILIVNTFTRNMVPQNQILEIFSTVRKIKGNEQHTAATEQSSEFPEQRGEEIPERRKPPRSQSKKFHINFMQ